MPNRAFSFLEPAFVRRIERSPFERDLLRTALGREKNLRILDATAGLCKDALRLAFWGHAVTACERDPRIAEGLLVAREEASHHFFYSTWISRLKIIPQSIEDFVRDNPTEKFDLITIDPMFPSEKRSSLPQKDLQFLAESVDCEDNASDLLNFCWELGAKKILLKRPLKCPEIGPRKPTHQFYGRAHRWDVFVNP